MAGMDHKDLNDIIHGRVRLAIMSFLMTAQSADFTRLKKELDLSDGNLSTHLRKLEEAGYVTIEKQFVGRKPLSTVHISTKGQAAFTTYLQQLEDLLGTKISR